MIVFAFLSNSNIYHYVTLRNDQLLKMIKVSGLIIRIIIIF